MNTTSLPQSTARPTFPLSTYSARDLDKTVTVGNHNLTIDEVASVSRHGVQVCLTENLDVLQGVQASCDYISNAVETGQPIYGVTTGFGGMANVVISPEYAALLTGF